MSNTSAASPVAAIVVGPIVATAAVVGFLCHLTEEERALRAEHRHARAREALGVTSLTLHATQAEPLVRTAERLGFRWTRLAGSGESVLLAGPSGERLALGREASGRLVIHSREKQHASRLLREHTADLVVNRLRAQGAQVKVQTRRDGSVRVEAEEADRGQRDGRARLRADVGASGQCTLDVSGIRGTRCSEFVADVAQAAQCRVTGSAMRDEAFELPGEPTIVRRCV